MWTRYDAFKNKIYSRYKAQHLPFIHSDYIYQMNLIEYFSKLKVK